MKRIFLEKIFSTSKTATIRKEIYGIRQYSRETLHEYWERFNKLCATCPNHHISEQLLIQYFYEGLMMMDRSMIDVASGGALMDKRPVIFGIRRASQSRMVNEIDVVDNLRLENQLIELTSLLRQLAVEQHQPSITARVCVICTLVEHPTDMCPTLQETESDYPQSVGAISGQGQVKGHMQLNDSDLPRMYLKDQQSDGSSNLHLQTIPNPRGNASVVTLRSGKELQQPTIKLEFNEELLRMFQKVEIKIPLLDAIKQIPKYAKFLKELCVHKRKKMKGSVEIGGIVLAFTRNKDFTPGVQ
ncbi:hypothetical protein CR513_35978, partial [Mucuna pruriens]